MKSRDRLQAALLLLGLAMAAPVWSATWLPLMDLPQHLAAIAVLHRHGDAATLFPTHFALALGTTQYLAYYLAVDALAYLLPLEVANRVVLTLAVAAFPLAARALLRALGRDERLAVFAAPLAWSPQLLLGFLNYEAALPLLLWTLARSARIADAPGSRREAAGLGALGLALFYTHLLAYLFALCGAALLGLRGGTREGTLGERVRASPKALAWLGAGFTPSLIALGVWLARTPASDPGQASGGVGATVRPQWATTGDLLARLPSQLLDLYPDGSGHLLLAALAACALWAAWPDPARAPDAKATRGAGALAGLAAGALVAYLVLPESYGWVWPFCERFAVVAALFLPMLARPLPGWRGRAPLAAAAVVALATSWTAVRHFRAFSAEADGFGELLARAAPAKKLVALVSDRGSPEVRFSPFLHFGSYYQARSGGIATFSFADFPQSPIRYLDADRPPRLPPRWEWTPERFRPDAEGRYYDYGLVRGPVDPFARATGWRLATREGRWLLYERTP